MMDNFFPHIVNIISYPTWILQNMLTLKSDAQWLWI